MSNGQHPGQPDGRDRLGGFWQPPSPSDQAANQFPPSLYPQSASAPSPHSGAVYNGAGASPDHHAIDLTSAEVAVDANRQGGAAFYAVATGVASRGPGLPSGRASRPLLGSLDDELGLHITTRNAKLTRDPTYMHVQRVVANRRRRRASLYDLVTVLDVALSLAALMIAQHYRTILSQIFPGLNLYVHVFGVDDTALVAGIVVVTWPVIFTLVGLYHASWVANRFSVVRVVAAVCASSLVTSGLLYFLSPALGRTRIFLIFFTILDILMLAGSRLLLRPLATLAPLRRRILIVGTGRLALEATAAVARRRKLGLELVGVVGAADNVLDDAGEPPLAAEEDRRHRQFQQWLSWRLGDTRDVVQIVRDREVDLVLVALSPHERYETSWVISSLAHLPMQLYVVPDVVSESAKSTAEVLEGMPLVGLAESGISGWSMRIKRLMDLLICLPILLVTWPLLLLIAVLIRIDSPGPALFKQERVGQHNRRFTIYKFRTMVADADQRAKDIAVRTAQGVVHKQRNDPRVTRMGAFLRKTSLDELPQLINVLRGDMSVVGPRPELPWIVERYRAWQYRRLLVPQGITGWWQVHGRSDRVLHLHTQDDIYYVRNYSLLLDLKILLMTIRVVLLGHGAF